jgi:glycerate 2-kinase
MKKDKIHILIAPNSLKGSLSAFEFADIVEQAFLKISSRFSIRKVPVADGGDFTGEILQKALKAQIVELEVKDPLGRPVSSRYATDGNIAVVEMADASGIKLLKSAELNPFETSSFGTGQLIADALKNGNTEIWLGVGGSATVDGGSGMLQALGFQLLDENNQPLHGNGNNLPKIRSIKKPAELENISLKIICDVDNPLLGDRGAATVFGPQKGATSEMVIHLEKGLANWCNLLESECGKNLSDIKGAGAAGGMALPLMAFFNAEIVSGAQFILSVIEFEMHLQWADVVITGEGKIDSQTFSNKAPKTVADFAKRAGKPVIAIGGKVESEAAALFDGGAFSFLTGPVSLEDSIKNANKYLFEFSTQLAKIFLNIHT